MSSGRIRGQDAQMTIYFLITALLDVLPRLLERRSYERLFWDLAIAYPDDAFRHFMGERCWKVFMKSLPPDYLFIVPRPNWAGPYRLRVPMLGGTEVVVFGYRRDIARSQRLFTRRLSRASCHRR
jgi:hypothetical protein